MTACGVLTMALALVLARSVLWVVAGIGALTVSTIVVLARVSRHESLPEAASGPPAPDRDMPRRSVVLLMVAFVLLQSTNTATVSTMTLFVTHHLGPPVGWAGVALGVAAAAEVPAMLIIGRLSVRRPVLGLIGFGSLIGVAYYAVMVVITNPWLVVAAQVLNAWFFATVAGPMIALAAIPLLGYAAVFAASAVLTVLALVIAGLVSRGARA